MPSLPRSTPRIDIDFTDERLTGRAGYTFLSEQAEQTGLVNLLTSHIKIKKRQRGASDSEMLWSLVASLASGHGHLSDVDALGCDPVAMQLLGLKDVPDSRRLGEYLGRFDSSSVAALLDVVDKLSRQIARDVIDHESNQRGYIPIFMDGSGIEVDGQLFEGAGRGYNGDIQYWLHTVFIGGLWVAGKLHHGGVDVAKGWQEQLEEQVAPLLNPDDAVWLRCDNAYYRKGVVEYCLEQGWDYSISLTNNRNKAPVLECLEDLPESAWEDIGGGESATWSSHTPAGWPSRQTYVVIRKHYDGVQQELIPMYTVILVSRDDLPLKELVKRHRGKQGQENALKGPLIEMGLHHPPMRSFHGNQAFYLCGQLAQLLLRAVQFRLLPTSARKHGIRPLIRYLMCTVARLISTGRCWRICFAKNAFRLDWLWFAAVRRE